MDSHSTLDMLASSPSKVRDGMGEGNLKCFLRSVLHAGSKAEKIIALKAVSELNFIDKGLIHSTLFLMLDWHPDVQQQAEQTLRELNPSPTSLCPIILNKNPSPALKAYLEQPDRSYLILKTLAVMGFVRRIGKFSKIAELMAEEGALTEQEVDSNYCSAMGNRSDPVFRSVASNRAFILKGKIQEGKLMQVNRAFSAIVQNKPKLARVRRPGRKQILVALPPVPGIQ